LHPGNHLLAVPSRLFCRVASLVHTAMLALAVIQPAYLARALLVAGLALSAITYTHSAFAVDPQTVPPIRNNKKGSGLNSVNVLRAVLSRLFHSALAVVKSIHQSSSTVRSLLVLIICMFSSQSTALAADDGYIYYSPTVYTGGGCPVLDMTG
jgi:hypothetical protein